MHAKRLLATLAVLVALVAGGLAVETVAPRSAPAAIVSAALPVHAASAASCYIYAYNPYNFGYNGVTVEGGVRCNFTASSISTQVCARYVSRYNGQWTVAKCYPSTYSEATLYRVSYTDYYISTYSGYATSWDTLICGSVPDVGMNYCDVSPGSTWIP